MQDWEFHHWYLEWTMWGLGVRFVNHRGWVQDEATLCIGPLRLEFLSNRQVRESEAAVKKALTAHRL